ncbi:hypothetical protein GQ600_10660 [Phytophthora cactorum]|nr:hypothetical protein GQ600_10660 [Phytophthora cactorum]
MTPLPPHLLSSIDRINAALEVAEAQPPQATGTLRVCQATEDEWNATSFAEHMSVHGSKDTWTPRILRGDDGVQTSVMDHAEQHRDPCFLQAFQI